jgi:hypothetical protein
LRLMHCSRILFRFRIQIFEVLKGSTSSWMSAVAAASFLSPQLTGKKQRKPATKGKIHGPVSEMKKKKVVNAKKGRTKVWGPKEQELALLYLFEGKTDEQGRKFLPGNTGKRGDDQLTYRDLEKLTTVPRNTLNQWYNSRAVPIPLPAGPVHASDLHTCVMQPSVICTMYLCL